MFSYYLLGCDSGIGLETAIYLYEKGFNVIATCLNVDGPGAEEIRKRSEPVNSKNNHIDVIECDVTWNESELKNVVSNVSEILDKNSSQLWALVNNAGIMPYGPFEFGRCKDSIEDVININLVGSMKMAKLFLHKIRRSGGRIINIASIAGTLSCPLVSGYGISKAGILAFSNALREEVWSWKVKVISILPGPFKTNIINHSLGKRIFHETDQEIREDYDKNIEQATRQGIDLWSKYGPLQPRSLSKAIFKCLTSPSPPEELIVGSFVWTLAAMTWPYIPQFLYNISFPLVLPLIFGKMRAK